MATISTCIIVKNEKDKIRNCLESVLLFSDEIIVYDTGSDDGTQDICREYNKVKVIQGEWHDDFAWARNQSFKYATCDYIFWIDADDTINEKSQNWLLKFKNEKILNGCSLEDAEMVRMPYYYDNNKRLLQFRSELLKRSKNPYWKYKIHEAVIFDDIHQERLFTVTTDLFYIQHNIDTNHALKSNLRNIKFYENMELNYELMDGREYFQYGKELLGTKMYGKAKDMFEKSLTKKIGQMEILQAYKFLSFIYSLESNYKEALKYLYCAACMFDKPRADVCCDIATIYKIFNNWEMVSWWYKMALNNVPKETESMMCEPEHYTIYPCLGLCESEYKLGHFEESKKYNEMTLLFDPTNEIALNNKRDFFS